VTVVDTAPPRVAAPPASFVYATTDAGIPRDDPAVQAFLAAARATDLVDPHPALANDAPTFLVVGTTTITFTARDASGNTATARAALTVRPKPPPGTPQPAPPTADTTPPDDVGALKAKAANAIVVLTWTKPRAGDFDHVEIGRSTTTPGAPSTIVYRGKATSYVDHGVRNGTEYRYLVVSIDRAGNQSRGVVVVATPKRPLLISPADGARLAKPPRLGWVAAAGASYYNVQVFRGTVKILSIWPLKNGFAMHRSWKYNGRRQRLARGAYRWYVWPGFGPRTQVRYGAVLGSSNFRIIR
jgi:hypothetical protein